MRALCLLLLAALAGAGEVEVVRAAVGDDPEARADAMMRLKQDAELRRAALPLLAKRAWDAPRMPRRIAALRALALLGPAAQSTLPQLLRATHDLKRPVRIEALAAIAAVGPDDSCAARLRELRQDEDETVRFRAVEALLAMQPDKKLPMDFARLLADPHPNIRWAALRRIAEHAPPPGVVKHALLALCADRAPFIRIAAIEAAVAMKLPAGEVVPILAGNLLARDEATRVAAADGLVRLAKAKPAPVDAALRVAARASDPAVRSNALRALTKLHPEPGAINDALRDAKAAVAELRRKEHVDRILRRAGGDRDAAIQQLLEDVWSPDADTRSVATYDLRHLRVHTKAVAVELVRLAKSDPDTDVREGAIWALAELPFVTAQDLAPFLGDRNDDVARAAADALLRRGKGAVVPLARGLAAKRPAVRAIAAEALGRLEVQAAQAVPALRAALKDADEAVREQVELALFRITGE